MVIIRTLHHACEGTFCLWFSLRYLSRIYSEKIDSGNFSKRFLIVKEIYEDGDLDLTLNIRTSNKNLSQVLKVSSRSFTEEEVYIASVKQ